MKRKGLFPFFDTAYQGFASGDLDRDAWAIRYFVDQGFQMMVAESFGKNMGLYGERVGALHVVCSDKPTSEKVKSQIMVLVRQMYLSPPLHGARIAERVLCNPTNIAAWKEQLKQVASRIIQVRIMLRSRLEELNTPGKDECDLGTWNHITDQIGMFSYTGLTEKQCSILIHKYHIHLLSTGRISLSGVNTKNVEHLAECIKASIDEAAE